MIAQTDELPPKHPRETRTVTFKFDRDLADGVTISTPTVTVTMRNGTDPDVADVKVGSAQVVGPWVLQQVTLGLAFMNYLLECDVDTSDGQHLVLAAILPVRTP